MTNVIDFPMQEGIIITEGTSVATGKPLYLLEYLYQGSRTVVGEYTTLLELAKATVEWEQDGVPLREPVGGAA